MPRDKDSALSLLHRKIQAFVQRQRWNGLWPIQEQAVRIILQSEGDLIISAPTSSGKSEAAFLPVLSRILGNTRESFQVLYVAPLKALINDQHERISKIVRETGVPVHKW